MTDDVTPNTTPEAPSWFIDDGIPGVGPRPTWLNEKFKTAADLGKSFTELEKKLGTAPEEYDFSQAKFIDPDYAPFQDFQQLAKDKRVPKEVMDKLNDSLNKYVDEFSTNEDEEIKKLGDNAAERLKTLDNWAKANLSQESYNALTSNLRNADSIKALEELRGKMMSSTPQIPNGNDGAVHNTATLDDIKMELSNNLAKYKADPVYRKDIENRLTVAAKNAPGFVDKVGA